MTAILAIDQGTTGSTALVVDFQGRVLGHGYREFQQFFPVPGEVEHDPAILLSSAVEAARHALDAAGVRVEALGITNQRETVVLWDADSLAPIGRAIVWQDRRTAARCTELRNAGLEPEVRERTGLLLDPYFSATKLEWLLAQPDIAARAAAGTLRAGTVESWLVAQFTGGVHVTDRTNSSRTLLASIRTGDWDPKLLELFGVPHDILPRVVGSAGAVGVVDRSWFGYEIPITGLVGDQQAALFGQGCDAPGMAKVTYGTGAFLLRFVGTEPPTEPAPDGILTTIAVAADGGIAWATEGSVFAAGAAVQWLRDGLGLIDSAAETGPLAASVPDAGGVVLVSAFTGLGAPHWNAEARAMLTGLTRGTTRAHVVRATLESICHSTCDLVDAMGGVTALRVDGGAASNDWLMQAQADLLGIPVQRPSAVELTVYGAARVAAIGLGRVLPPAHELGTATSFMPARDSAWRSMKRAEWRRSIAATLEWARGTQP